MGFLSTDKILTQGLEQAGDTTIRGPALVALQAWLRSRGREFPNWQGEGFIPPVPGSRGPYGGGSPFTLNTGNQAVTVGGAGTTATLGDLSVVPNILTIPVTSIQAVWLGEVGLFPPTRQLRIQRHPFIGNPPGYSPGQASLTNLGVPEAVSIIGSSFNPKIGQAEWSIFFFPVPVRNFDLYIYFTTENTAAITDASTSTPWYPNDETMIAAVELFALRHMKEPPPRISECLGRYREMLGQDRKSYFSQSGFDSEVGLDPIKFNQDSPQIYSPGITRR